MTYDDWKADVANRDGSAPCDEDPATDDAAEPQSCDACGHPTTIVRRVGNESLCDECAHREMQYELTTVDGDVMPVTLADFFGDNTLAWEDENEIVFLNVGETFHGGGGAAPEWKIRRVR